MVRAPRALDRTPLRAGPSLGKPVANAALLAAWVAAARRRRFDAVLAHNVEAALVALAARPFVRAPVVYVAHTLFGVELPTYGPRALAAGLRAAGRALDRGVASRAAAVVALSEAARAELARAARGPVEVIPPGLAPRPPPPAAERAAACARAGVEAGRFALYAGNLDAYQDLAELADAAARLPELPVVVATHAAEAKAPPGLRVVRVAGSDEVRALTFAAAVAVHPRRAPGGFPVKLLNYMEASRPIVARAGVADGFEHERNAVLLAPGDGPEALAGALRRLAAEPERAARLGRGARRLLEERHAWPALAEHLLALVRRIC